MHLRVLTVVRLFCLVSGLLMAGNGWAQTATLQLPAHPHKEEAVKPPMAAPRQPVHQVGSNAAGALPVVPPHGPLHPQKPPHKSRTNDPAAADSPAATATAPPTTVDAAKPGTPTPAETATVAPEKLPDPEKPEGTAQKLPRFASLRSDDVNMRLGPGTRYRIDWVYKRRELPVEIEREYDVWRWVRDADGIQGWVHQATLMGRRSFIVQNGDATLRSDPSDTASPVAILKVGVIGRIRSCEAASDWCNVQAGSYRGYLRRQQFWGVLPGEAVTP